MKENRYIKTKVDNVPTILNMDSCNLCPFLTFHKESRSARCSSFYSKDTNFNVIDNSVYSYSICGSNCVNMKELDIPKWCGLTNDLDTIMKEKEAYVKSGNNQYETVLNVTEDLQVYSSLFVEFDDKLNNLTHINNRTKTNTLVYKPVEKYIPVVVKRECSCCGEDKEEVNRETNSGMCNDCWVLSQHNEETKYFAYINNFRLKRKSTWIKEIPKMLKELC